MPEHKKKSGTRKYGRNKDKCGAYLRERKHVKSHIKRLRRHVSRHDGDNQAIEALRRFKGITGASKVRTRG